jgi:hypothetical protein
MSDVANICAEFGIAIVLPCAVAREARLWRQCAASTLQRLLSGWGESHLREVLLSIAEGAGKDRSLTAP